MRIAIGSDHAGYDLRLALLEWLRSPEGKEHQILDVGCATPESCDYPDIAAAVSRAINTKRADVGILLCGSGIGMAMAANKVAGVRAGVAWNLKVAKLAAQHNHLNVLCLPARFLTPARAKAMVASFLSTEFGGGRHARRLKKVTALDAKRKG